MSNLLPPTLKIELKSSIPKTLGTICKWKCDKGHEWEATVSTRLKGSGCPYCANRRLLTGFNDLKTKSPHLAKEFHPNKNNNLTPDMILYGSSQKVWWQCNKGHEWETTVESRYHTGRGCPYCTNRKILIGFNDLSTTHPEIAAQWHSIKNGILTPKEISAGSHKKVWWQCNKGHEWETNINKRTGRNYNCPYCSNQKFLTGFNDLSTTHPEIAAQWHPSRNKGLTPQEITSGSNQKVWWLCDKGHEWETSVVKRRMGRKCLYCSNQKVLLGYNDLATTHPKLLQKWHPTRNKGLTPQEITSGSNQKVWWQCEKGHEWETAANQGYLYNCPKCPTNISKAEKEIYTYLNKYIYCESGVRKIINNHELDIYIPEKNVAIEYNGLYWHSEATGKNKTYHYNKWLECKKQGIQLVQIWEDDWNRNPELIKKMLTHKLGLKNDSSFYARNGLIKEINLLKSKTFLEMYHIQGFASGSYYLGLFDKRDIEKLVAVLVLKKEPGTNGKTLNIIRYATSQNVVGGFTKLLKYAEKSYEPDSFITFSDNCVSDGGLYENNGFVADKELAPDYTYLVKGERKHKFGYRLKRFSNDPELQYRPGLTERELATLNGLPRVWDAGKTRWVKTT